MDKPRVDQLTVEAARRGDRGAQAALLRELQDVWYHFCLGLLSNAEDARDAVQETAVRFLRDLSRFRGDSSIKTWSLGIAVNVARELRRKQRPMRLIDEADESAGAPRIDDGPSDAAMSQEARSKLHESLRDLPQRQREALMLRFFEDMSVEQTAAAMDCAAGTVKATVHQALRALREKLRQLT